MSAVAGVWREMADAVSGSEDAFVQRMNQKAKSIGMKKSHFMDCTGLHDPEHYSTTYDIALLLKYALHNDTFRDVIESHFHSTPATNVHPDGITYYSTMFKNMSVTTVTGGEILGGKTGYTSEAGHCLASFAQIYRINLSQKIKRPPTLRLVVLDEAFSKMDAEKVTSCISLIRGLGFQAIISATNDKIQNYLENVDKTFVYANPNKRHISIQEFERMEFEQLQGEE
mgnify:CR=1 FL=1